MAKYSKQHLEIPKNPVAVLAMDTIGHLPGTFRGHQWALMATCIHTSYVFATEKSAENIVEAYLSNIFVHRGVSIAILNDSGTRFISTTLKEACD